MTLRTEAHEEAAEGGHDLAEAVDLGAEILVGAVGDEDHAVGGGEGASAMRRGYVTNMKRKHWARP